MAKKAAPVVATVAQPASVSMGLKVTADVAEDIERIVAHISHPGVQATKSEAIRFAIKVAVGTITPKAA